MAPAGGIERVLSQHITFLSIENEITVITDDCQKSFYTLPDNVKHISLDINTTLSMQNSKIHRVAKISFTFITCIKALRREIKKIKPDCVYTAHPLNLIKVIMSVRQYNKIFVTEHASITGYNKVYKKIATTFYKRIKLLAVPTTLDSEIYKNYGIDNVYLPNPLPFYPEASAKLSNKLALNIGRFTDDKQHLLLLELWEQSIAPKNGWKLKIIGKGENNKAILSKIEELNLHNSVFIEEPTKDIINEYMNASLFLFTSRAEGFGLVLAEAMACGVPCISFNCPSGPRDIISNGKDGYLIDVGNNKEYIERLNEMVSNEELRKLLGASAKLSIQKFSGKVIGEKLNSLVNSHFKI